MYNPDTVSLLTITMSKLLRINVQHTVVKGYHYFKIKPPKALFVEVHVYTMFTHVHIKMQLVWMPPFNELPTKLYNFTCKAPF